MESAMQREIVLIDEEKCDGCGLCVPACHEGAIQIIAGKARLVADNLCDGLGACLGHCPQGAIRIEKREAHEFDEDAVQAHLKGTSRTRPPVGLPVQQEVEPARAASAHVHGGGCPSQRFARLGTPAPVRPAVSHAADQPSATNRPWAANEQLQPSELAQWPVQLRLLPPRAPIFQDADLLLAADCVPFALPDFHRGLLRGRALAIACPKLDDCSTYVSKLTEIIAANKVKSITVVHMEVPCCTGILMMALQARANSGVDVPIEDVVVSVRGEIIRRRPIPLEQQK
jgi:NAD-dependent dihydropyrimidine dehydrogenase PreA subunit